MTSQTLNLSNWMAALDDRLTMDQLSIPGTHDSGTQKIGSGPYHTQNFGITQQLADGIRFLDIRLTQTSSSKPGDPLLVYHGDKSCHISFGDVLNDCAAFFSANPSEAVFMLVNYASGDDPEYVVFSGFQTYLDNPAYANLLCIATAPLALPLSALRGKVVLLRRFNAPASAQLGMNLQQQADPFNGVGWTNNDAATFNTVTPDGQSSLRIEDKYKTYDIGDKTTAVSNSLDKASQNAGDGKLYLTFNSIQYHLGTTPYQWAWTTNQGQAMNPQLKDYFQANGGKARLGVVALDFYNNETGSLDNTIVEAVVSSNFGT